MIEAVVFDMDGVIIDSEPVWQEIRVELVAEYDRVWTDADGDATRGLPSDVWAARVSERIEGDLTPEDTFAEILRRMLASYDRSLPLFPGAVEAVKRVASKYLVAVASGSPNALIDLVLDKSGLSDVSAAVGYGDDVERGKPAPDVYVDVLRRLGVAPSRAVAVEDSVAGLRSALSAGMHTIAIVSDSYDIPDDIVSRTEFQLQGLGDLRVPMLEGIGGQAPGVSGEAEPLP